MLRAQASRCARIVGLVLVAFACGVAWLQTCASLPAHPAWIAGAGAIALCVASTARDKLRPASLAPLVVTAALLAGCGYARWRAQVRLAEELPREWEGVDIEIVGVVADLPANSPQGTRFAFTVERVRTPRAVVPAELSLAWFAPRASSGVGRRGSRRPRRRTLVSDRAAEAPARHRQSRRASTSRPGCCSRDFARPAMCIRRA